MSPCQPLRYPIPNPSNAFFLSSHRLSLSPYFGQLHSLPLCTPFPLPLGRSPQFVVPHTVSEGRSPVRRTGIPSSHPGLCSGLVTGSGGTGGDTRVPKGTREVGKAISHGQGSERAAVLRGGSTYAQLRIHATPLRWAPYLTDGGMYAQLRIDIQSAVRFVPCWGPTATASHPLGQERSNG